MKKTCGHERLRQRRVKPVKSLEMKKQIDKMNLEHIKNQVGNAIRLFEAKNISALQQQLYELAMNFNKRGSGSLIINYPQKEQLAECFAMMLQYDWMHDDDIREAWIENGFYCIIEYMDSVNTQQDKMIGALDLFLLLFDGKKNLMPKIGDILKNSPNLMSYMMRFQQENGSFLIPKFVFDRNDCIQGAEYVINQFMFYSAQIIKPIVLKHPNILSGKAKECFNDILNSTAYNNLQPEIIFGKAKDVSKIIGYILEDF